MYFKTYKKCSLINYILLACIESNFSTQNFFYYVFSIVLTLTVSTLLYLIYRIRKKLQWMDYSNALNKVLQKDVYGYKSEFFSVLLKSNKSSMTDPGVRA